MMNLGEEGEREVLSIGWAVWGRWEEGRPMVAELNRKHWLSGGLWWGGLSDLRSMGEGWGSIKYRLRGIGTLRSMGGGDGGDGRVLSIGFAQYGLRGGGGGGTGWLDTALPFTILLWGGWRALLNGEKLPGEDVGVFYLDEVKVLSECMVGET